jgi:hypothetical protein
MIRNYSNSEAPNQYSFWSYCFALVSTFALADVFSGVLFRESVPGHHIDRVVAAFTMIAAVGVYALEAPPGFRFARIYSRHKL